MKVFPNYNVNDVSIKELYETEKAIFGFLSDGKMVTPNEYFAVHNNKIFDILSGIFYLSWVTVPIFLTIYFLYTKQKEAIHLPIAFLLVNLIGFAMYYSYPAAPPWYVAQYGFEFIKNTPGNPAGLSRFDDALGINLFHSMYQKSSNVFAAMPSLHSAYPVVSLYFALKKKLLRISVVIGLTAIGIWFFAVYSSHHYILDVVCGILCALVGLTVYQILNNKQQLFRKMIDGLSKLVFVK
ncbi:phosphatase PAP2 family protein [Chryseobacterium sp. Ch-15]|nr:phosphatase PAP2 family protein [Chryseobacterium muglaense]MBD3903316.1 inositol phosphorylceramide synthase [Chryseobacterium muglaense]MCM2553279.1 phosphatase PAP2 family protein [Chryseobacterium muglaense]